jgi:predicted HTH transcriptional regulator
MRMIRGEEAADVDYKASADFVTPEDIVAFSNGRGGTIIVGVKEHRQNGRQYGEVIGCRTGEEERRKLTSKANSCFPSISVSLTEEGSGRRKIIRVDVPESPSKPCCSPSGTYKIRRGSMNVAIDPELMTTMILQRESDQFLSRFKEAGNQIISALEKTERSLERQIEEVGESASAAASFAEDAASRET